MDFWMKKSKCYVELIKATVRLSGQTSFFFNVHFVTWGCLGCC